MYRQIGAYFGEKEGKIAKKRKQPFIFETFLQGRKSRVCF